MDSIILSGNNGSQPGLSFISFQLNIQGNGQTQLRIIRGRSEQEHVIAHEIKAVSPIKVKRLLEISNSVTEDKNSGVMLGGPEKLITIKRNRKERNIQVNENNLKANHFFQECLSLFNSGLKDKVDDYIYH